MEIYEYLGIRKLEQHFYKNAFEKIARRRLSGFKNTLKRGRCSGHVYNYKALQRVGGEPPVLQTRQATGSNFFYKITYIKLFSITLIPNY